MKNSLEQSKIITAKDENDLERFYPVIKELRENLSFQDYVSIYREANKQNQYQLVAIEEQGKILAVMGYRLLSDYVHGKHLYIDDLVTSSNYRSKGLGAKLLAYAEDIALKNNCSTLRLCTGVENESGKKFYIKNAWQLRAVVYKKKCSKFDSLI